MKKILIVYFSQTGQLKEILEELTRPLDGEYELVFEALKPRPPFPFPWNARSFFQAFPESVQEIPCALEPFSFNPEEDYAMVILGVQVWYLSPSIPVSAFLQSEEARRVMNGRPVITVQGVRNMWVMSQERIKRRILGNGGRLVGNIVMTDPHPNLVSVVTIVHWMMKGERYGKGIYGWIFPPAGIPDDDVRSSSRFGKLTLIALQNNELDELQDLFISSGGVKVNPVLVGIEKRGYAMFRLWSKFVLKKGGYGEPAREGRLRAFKYYLFTVIYLLSPIVSIMLRLVMIIAPRRSRRAEDYYSHNLLKG
jgi:hypothetical protein